MSKIKNKIVKHKAIKLIRKPKNQYFAAVIVIVAAAILGYFLFTASHAASPYSSAEAESGTLGGSTKPTIVTGSSGASGSSYVQFGSLPSSGNSLCGFKTGTPTISKVMIIWEENESNSAIIGNSSLPYMNSMATNCGYTGNYYAYTHPSLPNYMAMTSGDSYASTPWSNDCSPPNANDGNEASGCNTSNPSIFSEEGTNWKAYAESMPSNCDISGGGPTDENAQNDEEDEPVYAPRHNPAVYYTNITSACSTQDVPISATLSPSSNPNASSATGSVAITNSGPLYSDIQSGLAAFTTVTPNIIDDWHDGTPQATDNWLKAWIPVITTGSDYQSGKLAVLMIFDEGAGSGNSKSQTIGIWMSAYTKPGTVSQTSFNDYSVTKTVEDLLGLQETGNATSATSMASAFNL